MRRTIVEYPHPVLKQRAVELNDFGPSLHALLDDLFETMKAADGIGLAAPQVGESVRAFIVDVENTPGSVREFINPECIEMKGKIAFEEGCLSFPGLTETIPRAKNVTILYQDRHGKKQRFEAEGLLAVAIQHEYDHLDGVLFIERLPFWKRLWRKVSMNNR
jgi:peptide deformylase